MTGNSGWFEPPQYISIRYTDPLTEAGTEVSVGSVGDDNSVVGTINGLYKAEAIRRQSWKNREMSN